MSTTSLPPFAPAFAPRSGVRAALRHLADRLPWRSTSPASSRPLLRGHDLIVVAYLATLFVAVAVGDAPTRRRCLGVIGADLAILIGGLLGLRRAALGPRLACALPRILLGAVLSATFVQLREILPAVTTRAVDADLVAFDRAVFHVEPAVAWDRFVRPETVEWFAFFYFSYFLIVASHVVLVPLLVRSRRVIDELTLGVVLVYCVGQTTYMLVPGFGPYAHLTFDHPLVGGACWRTVLATVHEGGALKDIFPSLHTAVPTFLSLFAFRHRRIPLFRRAWPVLAFFTSQIIVATMFLRWHYLADVIAGVVLAFGVTLVVRRPWVSVVGRAPEGRRVWGARGNVQVDAPPSLPAEERA